MRYCILRCNGYNMIILYFMYVHATGSCRRRRRRQSRVVFNNIPTLYTLQ